MKNKKIITQFENYYDFYNRYDYLLNFSKHHYYTKKDVDKEKKGEFYKISDDCYVRLPKVTRKKWRIICASLVGLLAAGSAATVTVFYIPHKVTLNSEHLEIVKSNTARLANDYRCTFKIKDKYLSTRYMDFINVSAVKVNGNEIPVEDFYFTYQTNAKNELVINKKYLGGNIEIVADLIKREPEHHRCFFFGYEDFKFEKEDVIYPDKSKVGHNEVVIEGSTTDNMYLKDGYDMALTYAEEGPIHFNYNAFIVREDNAFAIKIHSLNEQTPLPRNLWFRCYAKFTLKDVDFTIDYINDYEAILKVNYFVIRDSGSIVPKPEDV